MQIWKFKNITQSKIENSCLFKRKLVFILEMYTTECDAKKT